MKNYYSTCDDNVGQFFQDASFVLSALVAAVEEGNLPGLENLFTVATNIDVNMANKVGCYSKHVITPYVCLVASHSKLNFKIQ